MQKINSNEAYEGKQNDEPSFIHSHSSSLLHLQKDGKLISSCETSYSCTFQQKIEAKFSYILEKLDNHDNKLGYMQEKINKYDKVWEDMKTESCEIRQKNMYEVSKLKESLCFVKEEIQKLKFKGTIQKVKFQPKNFQKWKQDFASEIKSQIKSKMSQYQRRLRQNLSQVLNRSNQQINEIIKDNEEKLTLKIQELAQEIHKRFQEELAEKDHKLLDQLKKEKKKKKKSESDDTEDSLERQIHGKLEKKTVQQFKEDKCTSTLPIVKEEYKNIGSQKNESCSIAPLKNERTPSRNKMYFVDQNNYLLDQNHSYLLDKENQLIQVTDKTIESFGSIGILIQREQISFQIEEK